MALVVPLAAPMAGQRYKGGTGQLAGHLADTVAVVTAPPTKVGWIVPRLGGQGFLS